MRVADILRDQNAGIVAIPPDMPVETALRRLREEDIGALVVKGGDGGVLGLFSEHDAVRALTDHGQAALVLPVASVTAGLGAGCGPRDDLMQVLKLMNRQQVCHVPVFVGGVLVGVVGIRDVIRRQVEAFEQEAEVFGPLHAGCIGGI